VAARNDQTQGLAALAGDIAAVNTSRNINALTRYFPSVCVIAVALFRTSQTLGRVSPFLAMVVKQINHVITGADIAFQAQAGPGLHLQHPTGVVIGPDVVIGAGTVIEQGATLGATADSDADYAVPVVGSGVLIGAGARIIGDVTIGDDAKIGANAVVLRDVPPGATAVGVPARLIERR
jgi:serine O-acetyltransferase